MAATKQVIKALKISDITMDDIIIGNKKTNKTVRIFYKENSLIFQTPFLEVTSGLKKTSYPSIYQLNTLFKGDSKQKIHNWYQFIENLETQISNLVINNDSKWFSQKNVVFKSLIRELDSEKGIFFVKWAIDLKNNIFVDEYKKPFNPTNLKENDSIKLIVEISDLWIHENQCGLAVIVQKVLVKPYVEKIQSEYIFDETDSENSDDYKENKIISLLATENKTRPVVKSTAELMNLTCSFGDKVKSNNSANKPQNNMTYTNDNTIPNDNMNKQENSTKNPLSKNPLSKNQNQNLNQDSRHHHNQEKIKNVPSKSQFSNKQKADPFRTKYGTSLREVFSDMSDDDNDINLEEEITNNKNNNMIKNFVDQYNPSSEEMAEISVDDLESD